MVDEADVRQDGNIDYKCLCSYFTLTHSIIGLFPGFSKYLIGKEENRKSQTGQS